VIYSGRAFLRREQRGTTPETRIMGPEDIALLVNGSVSTFPWQRIRTEQQRNCWNRCFLYGPRRSYINVNGLGRGQHKFNRLRSKVLLTDRVEPGTKNDCVGEGKQKVNRPTRPETIKYGHETVGPETKNGCVGESQQKFT
jgi:hypothetical protein